MPLPRTWSSVYQVEVAGVTGLGSLAQRSTSAVLATARSGGGASVQCGACSLVPNAIGPPCRRSSVQLAMPESVLGAQGSWRRPDEATYRPAVRRVKPPIRRGGSKTPGQGQQTRPDFPTSRDCGGRASLRR
jgi:hypothetical protein